MIKLRYLRDDLSADSGLWTFLNASIDAESEAAILPALNSTMTSINRYDATHSEIVVELSLPGVGDNRWSDVRLYQSTGNYVSMARGTYGLIYGISVDSSELQYTLAGDYNPEWNYWRIRERDGIVYFAVSSDGDAWETLGNREHGLDLTNVEVVISAQGDTPGDGPIYGGDEYGDGYYGGYTSLDPDYLLVKGVNVIEQDITTPTIILPVRAEPAPQWRWSIGPWRGSAGEFELTYATNRSINLHLKSPSEASFTSWGYSPEAIHMDELVTDLWVYRNGDFIYRGRIDNIEDNLNEGDYQINASAIDVRGVLDRRIVANDYTETDTDEAWIIEELIDDSQALPGGNLNITHNWGAGTGKTRSVEFKIGDSVWGSISKIINMDGGPDLWFDEHNVAYLGRLGEDDGHVLDYGGVVTSITRQFDSSKYANVIRQTGDNNLVPYTESLPGVATAPEGRWEALYPDPELRNKAMIDDIAKENMNRASRLLPTYQANLGKGKWGGPGHLWLGDTVTVMVKEGRLQDVYSLRIYDIDISIDVNGHETVTMTLGDPKVDLRSILRGIARRTQSLAKRYE